MVHFRAGEAAPLLRDVQACGFTVNFPDDGSVRTIMRGVQQSIPEVAVIDLGRLPSYGREIGVWLRGRRATRHVPLIFVGGEAEKVAKVRELMPDAAFITLAELPAALGKVKAVESPIIPPPMMDRYQGRTVAQKLGIRDGMGVAVINAPRDYAGVLGPLPEGATLVEEGGPQAETVWFIHEPEDLLTSLAAMRKLASRTKLWVLWRKGSKNGITQHFVREAGIEAGLVDYKICAVNGTWSAMAFARKKA